MKSESEQMKLVVIDDDEVDREVVRRALRKIGSDTPMIEAENGIEALQLLRGTADNAPLAKPYVIILDLNMPQMNGFEFLDELRSDSSLRYTPIFILSTSDATIDKEQAYRRCISGYIVKSQRNDGFLEAMTMLDRYHRVTELPV